MFWDVAVPRFPSSGPCLNCLDSPVCQAGRAGAAQAVGGGNGSTGQAAALLPHMPLLRSVKEEIMKPIREQIFDANTFWGFGASRQELFPSRTGWFRAEITVQHFARLPVEVLQLLADVARGS